MAWFALYRQSDGKLLSTGTVVADTLKQGEAKKQFPGDLPNPLGAWNEMTLSFGPTPPKPTPDEEINALLDLVSARNLTTPSERRSLKLTLQGLQEAGLF